MTVSPPYADVQDDSRLGTRNETVTVTGVRRKMDLNSVDETVTLTHTATVGDDEDEVALKNVSVTVNVRDNDHAGRDGNGDN